MFRRNLVVMILIMCVFALMNGNADKPVLPSKDNYANVNERVVPKSWIYLRDYNIYEKGYEDKDFSTVYVYDVSHSDKVVMKKYSSDFFYNPCLGVNPYHYDLCLWEQVGNYLFVIPSQFTVPGDYYSLLSYMVYIYEIKEDAELEEITSIDLRKYGINDRCTDMQFRLLGNTLELAVRNSNYIGTHYFDCSDMRNIQLIRTEVGKCVRNLDHLYFTDLSVEEQNKIKQLKALEKYFFLLPDKETIIHYKYKPGTAGIAPVIANINDEFINKSADKFCTGILPEGFDGMRRTKIFGNTLVKFLDDGCVEKYIVDYDGLITAYTRDDIYKAIEGRSYSDLLKYSVQCKEYYDPSTVCKVVETGDEKLLRAYLDAKHRYEYNSTIYTIVRSGNEKAIRLAVEVNPEWLNDAYTPGQSMSYSHGLMDYSPSSQISKLLIELGAPQEIKFSYTVYAGEECFVYVKPEKKSSAMKVSRDNSLYCQNRIFIYDKATDTVNTWIEIKLSNDSNIYYIPWSNGSWYWGDM